MDFTLRISIEQEKVANEVGDKMYQEIQVCSFKGEPDLVKASSKRME